MGLEQVGTAPAEARGGNALSATVYRLPVFVRRVILIGWDAMAWVLAMLAFLLVRYDFDLTPAQWDNVILYTGFAVLLQVIAGLATQMYLGRNRIGSFSEAAWMGLVVGAIALVIGLVFSAVSTNFPRGVAIVLPPMALLFMAAARFVFRGVIDARPRNNAHEDALPALVYGAGNAGYQVAQLMDLAEEAPYRIVGFLDDDKGKRNLRIRNYRVLGRSKDLIKVAKERQAQVVILAISDAGPQLIQKLSEQTQEHNLELLINRKTVVVTRSSGPS